MSTSSLAVGIGACCCVTCSAIGATGCWTGGGLTIRNSYRRYPSTELASKLWHIVEEWRIHLELFLEGRWRSPLRFQGSFPPLIQERFGVAFESNSGKWQTDAQNGSTARNFWPWKEAKIKTRPRWRWWWIRATTRGANGLSSWNGGVVDILAGCKDEEHKLVKADDLQMRQKSFASTLEHSLGAANTENEEIKDQFGSLIEVNYLVSFERLLF